MGVSLGKLVADSKKEIDFEYLRGKTIGIDAYNWMYQFLSVIRDRFTGEPLRDPKGKITSHLSGLFYRTARLLEAEIIPVYVFDGKPPEWKKRTIEERKKIRQEAEEKWKEAVEKGEEAIKYAQGASRLTDEMIEEAKKLLEAMGVSWVQAPSEGEAQVAYMVKDGQLWAGASQDFDSLLFGSQRLIRNLNITGRKKLPNKQVYVEVKPEIIELKDLFSNLGIDNEQLILIGLLIGTDFNPGVKGYGPLKALELVKKEKTAEKVKAAVNWDFVIPIEALLEFFKTPPSEDMKIEKNKMDIEKLKKLLVDNHGFAEDRINSISEKLANLKKSSAASLNKFLK